MNRRGIFSVIALAVVVLGAQAAAAGNCVDEMTRGGTKDWVCYVQSDFAPSPFMDCMTFIKADRDHFWLNVAGLTPFFAPGGCNDDGSLRNPRFGRSSESMATFGFPFNSPLSITFTFGHRVDFGPYRVWGRAHSEQGAHFLMKCRPDGRNQCPLAAASEDNWVKDRDR